MDSEWIAQFPKKQFSRDSRLFLQGDPLEYCYYLTKGICSQLVDYENGTEVVTKYYFPGDFLNIWGVLKHKTVYASTVVAKTDIYAVVIPALQVRRELDENNVFYRQVVEAALENNQYVYQQYQKKAKGNAAEILCYAILALSQVEPDGKLYLSKDFAFCDLAQHLRIHRVTVSHVFKTLQEEKIIRKCDRGWRILDAAAVEEYAQGNRSLNSGLAEEKP
jgi:CRP-like cAMP-binding protein